MNEGIAINGSMKGQTIKATSNNFMCIADEADLLSGKELVWEHYEYEPKDKTWSLIKTSSI
jgi:hypothetical protein